MKLRSTLPLALLALSAVGCKMERKPTPTSLASSDAAAVATASGAPSAGPAASARARKPQMPLTIPARGPGFMVLPGEGLSTIRFGATRETVERQMEAPCEVVENDWCHYFERGVSFRMEKGAVTEIRAFRPNRSTGRLPGDPHPTYQTFNGRIEPDVTFLMSVPGVQEGMGQPLRIEKVTEKNATDTVERHYYDGMIAEFDFPDFANVPLLGAVIVTKSEQAKQARSARRLGKTVPPRASAK